jgi:hypothetical protein
VLLNQIASVVAVFFGMFQENLDSLDGHGAIAEDGQSRHLARLHKMLEDEQQFLGTLNGERGHDNTSATLGCGRNQGSQFRQRILRGMQPVSVS